MGDGFAVLRTGKPPFDETTENIYLPYLIRSPPLETGPSANQGRLNAPADPDDEFDGKRHRHLQSGHPAVWVRVCFRQSFSDERRGSLRSVQATSFGDIQRSVIVILSAGIRNSHPYCLIKMNSSGRLFFCVSQTYPPDTERPARGEPVFYAAGAEGFEAGLVLPSRF